MRSDISTRVSMVVHRVLNRKPNEITHNIDLILDLDIDSLQSLELVEELEKEFQTDIFSSEPNINNIRSISAITEKLITALAQRADESCTA